MNCFLVKLQKVLSCVSWLTLLAIGVKAVMGIVAGTSWNGPEWLSFWVLPIMIAAAVGYLTNYIAIEMLFQPYERTGFHWLRLISLGLWRQGMIPANKEKIGHVLGTEITERLLKPEVISREISAHLSKISADPALLDQIRTAVPHLLRKNEDSIIGFLIPQIEKSISDALAQCMTPENLRVFWDQVLEKNLASPEMREKVAAEIVSGLRARTPELRNLLREFLRDGIRNYLKRVAIIGMFSDKLSGLVDYLDWNDIEQQLSSKLSDRQIHDLISAELTKLTLRLHDWLHGDEAAPYMQKFLDGTREKFRDFLHEWLSENMPQMVKRILTSDDFWNWIRDDLLPALQRYFNFWMARDGRRIIVEMLDLNNRIEQAVAGQNVREFHEMINRITAEHLGTIQVLGYVLGAIVGALQQVAALVAR